MKIGDLVKVTECHKIPVAVGKMGKIVADKDMVKKQGDDLGKYDFIVAILPFQIDTPQGHAIGLIPPLVFRADELQLVDEAGNPIAESTDTGVKIPQGTTGVPKAFLEGMDGKPEDNPPLQAS